MKNELKNFIQGLSKKNKKNEPSYVNSGGFQASNSVGSYSNY